MSPWCVALNGAKPADVTGNALEENTPPQVLISACHTIAQTDSFVVDFESTFFKTDYVNILEERRNELSRLETGKIEKSTLHIYLKELLLQAQPLSRNTNMRFFGFDRPNVMPADARVDYFYWPTYISTACCMKAILLCPEIINMIREDVVQSTGQEPMAILAACMRGCTGLGFYGHGYENIQGLVETMDFFTAAHVQDFIAKYPHVCPEFTACFKNAVNYLADSAKNGKVAGVWGDDHTDRALVILDRLGINIEMEV